MAGKNFHEVIRLIRKEDDRYEAGAYLFLRRALDHTLKEICERESSRRPRHVTGQELCVGIRDYALQEYGPMTRTLLENWGIHRTEDFGQMVYNLVEFGIFGKTETDSLSDFERVYDFEVAFSEPFRPSSKYLEAQMSLNRSPS